MTHAELGDDLAAERVTEKDGPRELRHTHPGGQSLRKRRHVERLGRLGAQPEARQVRHVYAARRRETRHGGQQVAARHSDAVDEHDHRRVTGQRIRREAGMHPHAADRGPVAPELAGSVPVSGSGAVVRDGVGASICC
jgi:hypothetical protein